MTLVLVLLVFVMAIGVCRYWLLMMLLMSAPVLALAKVRIKINSGIEGNVKLFIVKIENVPVVVQQLVRKVVLQQHRH